MSFITTKQMRHTYNNKIENSIQKMVLSINNLVLISQSNIFWNYDLIFKINGFKS